MLKAIGVVKVVTGKRLAPVFEYPHKACVGKLPGDHIFWQNTQAASRDGGAQDRPRGHTHRPANSNQREGCIWWARMTAMPQCPKGQDDMQQGILARTGSHLREGRAWLATDQAQERNHGSGYPHRLKVH